jgi:hypothetical protein
VDDQLPGNESSEAQFLNCLTFSFKLFNSLNNISAANFFEYESAERRWHATRVDFVFHENRNAMQRSDESGCLIVSIQLIGFRQRLRVGLSHPVRGYSALKRNPSCHKLPGLTIFGKVSALSQTPPSDRPLFDPAGRHNIG